MEQLTFTATNDKLMEILDELMENGKQFQLLITVTNPTLPLPNSQTDPSPTYDLEKEVTATIHGLGIPAHIKGYQYLRYAILSCMENPALISSITKSLYPAIAEKYDSTPSRVERAIRHAIEVAWSKGSMSALENMFGYTVNSGKGKPTNSEFIALLTDRLQLNIKRQSSTACR